MCLFLYKTQRLSVFFAAPLNQRDLSVHILSGEIGCRSDSAVHVFPCAIQRDQLIFFRLRRVIIPDFKIPHFKVD